MAMVDVTTHETRKDASRNSQKLRKDRLAGWASMGVAHKKEHTDSETGSDVELCSEDSDNQGLSVMNALYSSERINRENLEMELPSPCLPEPSSNLSADPSPSVLHAAKLIEMEECMQRLGGYVLKYPVDGRKWFAKAKERYFSVVVPMLWHPKGNRWLQSGLAQLEQPSLCYWVDELASLQTKALGVLPIASITEVTHDSDEDQGLLVKVRTASKSRYSHSSKANVVQVGDFVLTLRFSDATEAECWACDFKAVVRWVEATDTR